MQGAHQPGGQRLAHRIRHDQALELGDEGGGDTGAQVGVDAVLGGEQAELIQAGDDGLAEIAVGHVHQGRAAPQRERQAQGRGRGGRIVAQLCSALGGELFEPHDVGRAGIEFQLVAGRPGFDDRVRQRPAQPGDQGLQRVRRAGRRLVGPQPVDQLADRDQLAGTQRQHDQQCAQPGFRRRRAPSPSRHRCGPPVARAWRPAQLNCARAGDVAPPGSFAVAMRDDAGMSEPAEALRQIAFQLERGGAPTYRVRAFRNAAEVLDGLAPGELDRRIAAGTLEALKGIGATTAEVITQAAAGQQPAYLARLLGDQPPAAERTGLRAALRGDCHMHSSWSDGGSPPREMAEAARALGHEWVALTDHSPRLTVANGLSAERLIDQLQLIDELNAELAPFRILTGIEVDILDDGSLDQREDLLRRLDVVVASVHSKLRMPAGPMTKRMVAAVRNPHVDVLGHCTGRLLSGGRGRRPESAFDPRAVFGACQAEGVAVEINCRPERRDPPTRLLRLAAEIGCVFAIDTDAHAPGQLDWLGNGTVRAEDADITADRIINTRTADELIARRARQA